MKTLGFTSTFYTLWEVSERYKYYFTKNSFEFRVDKRFIKNLSKDKEEAIQKIEALTNGNYVIDLDLKGEGNWTFSDSDGFKIPIYKEYQFPYSFNLEGKDIRTCTDTSALWVMYLKKIYGIIKSKIIHLKN